MHTYRFALTSMLLTSLACSRPPDRAQASESGEDTETAVCKHITSIMTRDNPGQFDAATIDGIVSGCIASARVESARIGQDKFRMQADCILAATSAETLQQCYRRSEHEEYEALCQHVFATALREEKPDLVGVEELPADLLAGCAADLAKLHETTPEEYARHRECIFAAKSIAAIEACDGR